jgi:DNA-binding CsgD family transcriptional regulator
MGEAAVTSGLLEREPFLEALEEAHASARAGRGRMILIAAEAGGGKTALVEAFRAEMDRGVQFLFGACEALFTPRPLGPFAEVGVETGGDLARLVETEATPHEVLAALLDALGTAPTVLVLEDVHWADEATLDVLQLLGRRVETTRSLVIATYRDDEIHATHPLRLVLGGLISRPSVDRITLPPLSRAAVGNLANPFGADPDELFRRTGGNPFFVTEALAGGDATVPETVRDAVLARASSLSAPARALLETVAVVPGQAELRLLEAVAAAELDSLEECLSSGMLVARDGSVAFRHELARLAVEESIAAHRRRSLHATFLSALADGGDDARLAHHADAAGDREALLKYAVRAGERAAALGAHREAAAHYASAVRSGDPLPDVELASLLERRAYECYLTGQIEEALAARRAALDRYRRVGDRVREGDQLRWISRLFWFTGRDEEADKAARAAVAILEPLPPGRELAMAYSNVSQLRMLAHDVDESIDWGERAIGLAERLGDREVLVHALNNVGTSEWVAGIGPARLERSLALALEADLEEHVARAYTNLGALAVCSCDYDRGEAVLSEAIAYTIERDLDSWRLYMTGWQAKAALDRDRWDEAAAGATSVLADLRTPESSQIMPLVVLGVVRARRGDPDAAEALDRALELAQLTGEPQRLTQVAAARAEAAFLAGDAERAVAEARLIDLGAVRERWAKGELAVWIARSGGEMGLLDAPEPYALELAGRHADAAAWWRGRRCRYAAALSLAAGGAEDLLRVAFDELTELGARPAAALVARRLRELGARGLKRGPRAATRDNPANLTARELEVLALVAEGLKNAEIAERLFLSPKTVDHHVSAILRKLGASTRAEAGFEAARLGLAGQDR